MPAPAAWRQERAFTPPPLPPPRPPPGPQEAGGDLSSAHQMPLELPLRHRKEFKVTVTGAAQGLPGEGPPGSHASPTSGSSRHLPSCPAQSPWCLSGSQPKSPACPEQKRDMEAGVRETTPTPRRPPVAKPTLAGSQQAAATRREESGWDTHRVQVLDAGAQPLLDLAALLGGAGVRVDVAVVTARQNSPAVRTRGAGGTLERTSEGESARGPTKHRQVHVRLSHRRRAVLHLDSFSN